MTNLSQSAQAVRDAAFEPWQSTDTPESIAAAVLRAAVDQVVPEEQEPVPNEDSVLEMQMWARVSQRQRTRNQLLAIAAELENN